MPTLALVPMLLAVFAQSPSRPVPAAGTDPPPIVVREDYDRFKDDTTLVVDLGRVGGEGPRPLSMFVYHAYKGKGRRPAPETIAIGLVSRCDSIRLAEARKAYFLADGRRVERPTFHRVKAEGNLFAEVAVCGLVREDVAALARAVVAEGKVGDLEFNLSGPQKSAILEYLSYVDDPSLDANRRRREVDAKAADDQEARAAAERDEILRQGEQERAAEAAAAAKEAADIEGSEKLLAEAKALDRASKTLKAMEVYRAVVRKYPRTPSAKQAEARLKVMMKAKAVK